MTQFANLCISRAAAFRDRNAGSDRNRGKPTEESAGRGGARGGYGARVRGSKSWSSGREVVCPVHV